MTETVSNSPRVLVSGASVSGLTCAYWLSRYGFDVTVVERAPHLWPGGHALDVRGPALDIADRMGLLPALRERSTQLTGIAVVDDTGNEVFRSTESTLTGGRLSSPDIEILRDDLCQVLLASVDRRVEFLFDDRITSLRQDESGVDVAFLRATPRRFDVVIGADGLYSGVRRIAFGPDETFMRSLGNLYVATFGMPNFLKLERWQTMYQAPDSIGVLVMGLRKDVDARVYLGFTASEQYRLRLPRYRSWKRLLAERAIGAGWVVPQVVEHMLTARDFHFYSLHQVQMDTWSRGRVVLCGDAGYAVSLGTGQATTVAMVGAYVLAGELATHRHDLTTGIAAYERALRAYVTRNHQIAQAQNQPREEETDSDAVSGGLPDFGALTLPFTLEHYGA